MCSWNSLSLHILAKEETESKQEVSRAGAGPATCDPPLPPVSLHLLDFKVSQLSKDHHQPGAECSNVPGGSGGGDFIFKLHEART